MIELISSSQTRFSFCNIHKLLKYRNSKVVICDKFNFKIILTPNN
jgi:hypothetical protein